MIDLTSLKNVKVILILCSFLSIVAVLTLNHTLATQNLCNQNDEFNLYHLPLSPSTLSTSSLDTLNNASSVHAKDANPTSDIIDNNSEVKQETNHHELKFIKESKQKENVATKPHLQTLQCESYGGPSGAVAKEMVYWWKIPSDEHFLSSFQKENIERGEEKYLIFQADEAGWNNIRMSLETVITMAIAMGRIIVLPPETRIYLLWENKTGKQKHRFTFRDFFHLEEAEIEHKHLKFISMDEYLTKFAITGQLTNKTDGNVIFPPGNKTDFNNADGDDKASMWKYIEATSYLDPSWKPMDCFSYFPTNHTDLGPDYRARIQKIVDTIAAPNSRIQYIGKPTPVDAPMIDRLKEHIVHKKMCWYDNDLQKAKFIHFKHNWRTGDRFLLPFYAFNFFEDWKQELWTKRFVRDHLRYNDELFCAAARVVGELREKAKLIDNGKGRFHTMHIRRGDFKQQYKGVIMDEDKMIEVSKSIIDQKEVVYIGTDEKNMTFFTPFKQNYNVFFLSDFVHLLADINSNYYPLIEQLILSRGDKFIGTHFSTFTGYINRLRGYYSWRDKLDGHEEGGIDSYFFTPSNVIGKYKKYFAIAEPLWAYDFPEAWFDLNKDIELL